MAAQRTSARRSGLAVVMGLMTVAMSSLALTILVATRATPVEATWGFRGYAIILAIGAAIVGFVLSVRVPGNRVGWLAAVAGLLSAIQAILSEYTTLATTVAEGSLPAVGFAAWLNSWIWVWAVAVAAIALPLTFPTGRLALPGDRRIGWFAAVAVAISTIVLAIAPVANVTVALPANPFHLPVNAATLEAIGGLAYPPLGIATVLSASSVIRRFRRSRGEVRQQLKWFAFAMAGLGLALGFGLTVGTSLAPSVRLASSVATIVAFIGVIAAVGIAVLRYRLYDIDRIVSRTISYGAVTAVLVAAYAVAVLLLQDPLGSITGGDTVPVAVSTLVVAGLFDPLRRRVQTIVDRRFDRARFDAERTTADFADRLREQVDLPMLTADIDSTVRAAIAPSSVGLWLRENVR